MDFKDKVIIITGSSSGIGATTAECFAKQSAKVVIVGRNEEKLQNVAKRIEEAKGPKPFIIKADVTNDEDINKVVDETLKQFGKIYVLINNAGAGVPANLQDGIEPFDKLISTNLRSAYLLTSLAVPHLTKTKGNIINVSSLASVTPSLYLGCYCISKAGLDMFTKCAAKELAPKGVRVNSVNPGPVRTNFQAAMFASEEMAEDYFNKRLSNAVLGDFPTTEDVAELIMFLASDKAKSITGSINLIDGGYSVGK